MNRNAKRIIAAAVVLLLVAGGAFALFVANRDDNAEPKATESLRDDEAPPSTAGAASAPVTLDGSWTVQPGRAGAPQEETTFAGYRVKESFVGGLADATATGRTPDATGTLTVQGDRVTAAQITADLTTLRSDEGRRDAAIRTRGLETTKFPEATFVLGEPITLPDIQPGQVFEAKATGKLTLHGVTQDVAVDLTGKQTGDRFIVAGEVPIRMADYRIDPPNVGGFVTVEDRGSLEFNLVMTRAAAPA